MEDRAGVTWRGPLFLPSLLPSLFRPNSLARPGISNPFALRTFPTPLCVRSQKDAIYIRPSTNHRDTRPNFLSLNVQPRRVGRPRADDNRFPFPRVRFDVEINTEDYSVSSFFSIVQADSSSRNSLSLVDRNLGVFPPRKVSGRGRNSSLPVETCKL